MFSYLKKVFKGFHFHRYKKVYKIHKVKFLDEECEELEPMFRICEICGKAQSLEWWIEGYYWETLDRCRTEALLNSILDRGSYYVLK